MEGRVRQGGFGTVHLATRKRNGQSVAVKKVPMSSAIDEADLRRELDVMRKIDHPHVIRTMDAYWASEGGTSEGEKREIWLVAEYCAGGELFEWCKARTRTLREADHQRLSLELLRGLAYLHAHGVIHRDIKPKNVLMATAEDNATLQIADFGLARRFRKAAPAEADASATSAETSATISAGNGGAADERPPPPKRRSRAERLTRSFLGTAGWMAPEVITCACEGAQGYAFSADVFSAGAVIYALLTRRYDDECPFHQKSIKRQGVADGGKGEVSGDGHSPTPYHELFLSVLDPNLGRVASEHVPHRADAQVPPQLRWIPCPYFAGAAPSS